MRGTSDLMALIQYLTQIQFEAGAVRLVGQECARLNIARPMIVTDKGVRAAGLLDRVTAHLEGGAATPVFDGTQSNPTEASVHQATALYKTNGCDGVIGLGGGSSIDLGKAVALMATHEGALKSYMVIEGGVSRITAAMAPVIAIPTTAGTGSEVGRGAVIILAASDNQPGRKLTMISPHMIPKVAICDPELTYGLPPLLTAATGMDAIAHCIETFLSAAFNPPAEGIALDGLRRAWTHIERATKNGTDTDARLNMMSASTQGALAFQKGLGCVHSLSHSLGGVDPRLHHGTLNAMFLPAVIRFNAEAESVRRERKIERLAETMGLNGAQAVAPAITAMNAKLGLPSGLRAMGVTEEQFPKIIQGALADHTHKTNPREASAADYAMMLRDSL
jgi:4-hydroxybutyrate dehydrogenase